MKSFAILHSYTRELKLVYGLAPKLSGNFESLKCFSDFRGLMNLVGVSLCSFDDRLR